MKVKNLLYLLIILSTSTYSQNTVGILTNSLGSFNGYTLLAPLSSTETYLINNCGQVVNQWSSSYAPSASVYLLENGNLLRTGKIPNTDITFGGVGGKIELFDWNGNLLWEYTHSSTEVSQHHDIYPLPNGNILMLAVNTMTETEAIQAGRDPAKINEGKIFNEQILELEPIGSNQANVVWEWSINDHLIQDFDNTKDNFGVIANNHQLLNFNYISNPNDTGNANWLHMNSIQYNNDLDQIIISTRNLDEIYILDHSTTTTEAASSSGGTYGKGGDFLYRWGNPAAYNFGTTSDRVLIGQHNPHWIPNGLTDAGKIMIFNNGNVQSVLYSSIDIINPPQSTPGFYNFNSTSGFGPIAAEWQYTASIPTDFYSAILSSGQRLPNGNTLICDGDSGYFFEIDTNNNIVWEYINPVSNLGILSQGDNPSVNLVFRAHKFPVDYAAFTGRDLTPGDPIELDYDIDFCSILSVDDYDISNQIQLFPNPTSNTITVNSNFTIDKLEVYDLFGKLITSKKESKTMNIESLATGIYFVKIYSNNKFGTKKIIKQ